LHDVNISPNFKTCQSSGNANGENPDVTYVTLSWQRAEPFPYQNTRSFGPLRLNEAYALILFYLYHILSLVLLASVMSGNKLEEGVKSPKGKFLFSLPLPDLPWAYPASLSAACWNPF